MDLYIQHQIETTDGPAVFWNEPYKPKPAKRKNWVAAEASFKAGVYWALLHTAPSTCTNIGQVADYFWSRQIDQPTPRKEF